MMVALADFTSYDLDRLRQAMVEAGAGLDDPPAAPLFRAAAQRCLPYDQRAATPWHDLGFEARYAWLRAQLIPADAPATYPAGEAIAVLAGLVVAREAQEAEEPF